MHGHGCFGCACRTDFCKAEAATGADFVAGDIVVRPNFRDSFSGLLGRPRALSGKRGRGPWAAAGWLDGWGL